MLKSKDNAKNFTEEDTMPTYDYKCLKCEGTFSKVMSITERESKKIKCPECKSSKVKPVYSGFVAKTSRKS